MRNLILLFLALSISAIYANQDNLDLYTIKSHQDFIAIKEIARTSKIHEHHNMIRKLAEQDPGAIRYIVSHFKNNSLFKLPAHSVKNVIFAQNKKTSHFITHEEYLQNPNQYMEFSSLDKNTFSELVVYAYEQQPRDFEIMFGTTKLHRDQIIREIRQQSKMGQMFISIERDFLNSIRDPFWEFVIDVQTDQNGNFTIDYPFDSGNSYVRTIQLRWRGMHEAFSTAKFEINGKNIFENKALNYEEYDVNLDVSAKNNHCKVTAQEGPSGIAIQVVLSDCGCSKEESKPEK